LLKSEESRFIETATVFVENLNLLDILITFKSKLTLKLCRLKNLKKDGIVGQFNAPPRVALMIIMITWQCDMYINFMESKCGCRPPC